MLTTELLTDLSALRPLCAEWDELSLAAQMPMMSSACVLAWWTHMAPETALPRIVAARDGERLVGLAPFYVDPAVRRGRLDLRLPGIELAARLAPLAVEGRESEVTDALTRALSNSHPRADVLALEGSPISMTWASALRASWPGHLRPLSNSYSIHSCPIVSLQEESHAAWLASKSSNFRSQMRRLGRQFAAAGGMRRSSTLDTLATDVDIFMRLHASRWEGRGESHLLTKRDATVAALVDIGVKLVESGQFRMRLLEVDGEPISAQLFLATGGRVLYVNGGWDERFARLKPPMVGILDMIEEAFERGEQCLDLGVGDQPYKGRFADRDEPVAWTILLLPRARLPLTCARVLPTILTTTLRHTIKRRLPADQLQRYRRIRGRLRRQRQQA
ncbi:MAG TPA: GNAT family N-acetyltransferase [Solirubrobacteraceae bacterium]|jgi:CelD/BcsL family acetyltransferase involved in cellulose biosynthesis|nr:GNAT family N-acetyltransferase [Solirubrobacteraceae bacterium]